MTTQDKTVQNKTLQNKTVQDKTIKNGGTSDELHTNDLGGDNLGAQNNGVQDVGVQDVEVQNLRQKAETLVNKSSHALNVNDLTIDAINQLLHELQVHQIELEMQNEELQEANIALDILRSRYFDLYDLAPVGYLTLNARGLIQKANLTAATLLGMTRNILIKQPISNLIFKDDEDIYYLHHKKVINGSDPQSFDLRLIKNDQTAFWANMVITLGNDNETEGNEKFGFKKVVNDKFYPEKGDSNPFEMRVVIGDVSGRKQAERALQEAKLIAEEANSAKSTFLSSMSHELRTPLNAILGFAQLIDASEPQLSFNQKRNTEQIVKAGWYLLTLINEILDLSAIDSGKVVLSVESLSLSDVLSDACAMLENQAQNCGIAINYTPSHFSYFVAADPVRLKQVFVNLLSNAIKYNKPNGKVNISCVETANQRIRIFIEDTGEGIAAKDIAGLFQPFNRLGKQLTKIEGTGIGLVVCKRIVEAMNGAIGVDSTVGKGCMFWVELNLSDSV